ncbi:MAG: T9SS type A sorting domain-containing protein, partial [Ignavibacteriaceae bacterium]
QSPDTIWAGTEIGLFESTDNGTSWHAANNGLPTVSIWAMTHVEDEIVIATHGRGIWSVKIPELGNAGVYKPLIKSLTQNLDGQLEVGIRLRSLYDSTVVNIDGSKYLTLSANNFSNKDTSVAYSITQAGSVSVTVSGYKNGTEYKSITKNISVVVYKAAQNFYINNFNTSSNDFFGSGFQIKNLTGFPDKAIHSAHPYANSQNLTYSLSIPIIVASADADLTYDDVAIMEPGDAGAVFGDSNFWDYVIAEATSDGINWIPLEDGYDSNYDPEWTSAYNNNTPGNSTMLRKHQINLLDKFNAGDKILFRFRLFSDGFVTGWGWAIDNLEIQKNVVAVKDEKNYPINFELSQNFPNPFNPSTIIKYQIPQNSLVTLKIYDAVGKEVATLINQKQSSGTYQVKFDAASTGKLLASGVYFYRIQAGDFTSTKKFILLK